MESPRDRLVCGHVNPQIQKRLLSEDGLTLDKAVQLALAMDTTMSDTAQLQKEKHDETTHATRANKNSPNSKFSNKPRPNRNQQTRGDRPNTKCRNCGGVYPHTGECSTKGKDCYKCGKANHYSKYCRSKPCDNRVKQISEETSAYVFATNAPKLKSLPSCKVEIAGTKINMGLTHKQVSCPRKLAFQN
ncbi:hypothetical protein BSL78_20902 [Apostichopus japonicus]|uniref:CCHC-type domain-containing protein n=1 Tax=Stichopus japonicus TaxID=307972 RepID=A0A2G8K2L2_STIJA|nr:hypothetical protein BSL78_20902 [Apostichopus japonicus]